MVFKGRIGYIFAMFPFSLKVTALALTGLLLGIAPVRAEAMAMEADDTAAVIFAYFAVGRDDTPAASVTREQFLEQVEELTSGAYTVLPLPRIVDAFNAGKALPPRTVALTFDGADKSVMDIAAPLLIEKDLPFTVFIPSGRVDDDKTPFLSWDDLRSLKKTGLVSFGLHPAGYSRLSGSAPADIRGQINSSLADIREELDVNVTLFAYPFGEYDTAYKKIVDEMGFKAAFGQQSGVAYAGDDRYALPRFTLTERYADMDRFVMTANALPMPVRDVSPADPHLDTLNPVIGFTLPESLSKSIKSISCFSSSDEKPKLDFLGSRIEIRMSELSEDRPRINCTLPVATAPGEDPRWRWFGMMYTVPAALLEAAQKPTPQDHAGTPGNDSINME
jgi:peptidoglycan/xylan/chitin deacetylase (PgdA/CDA1 family)